MTVKSQENNQKTRRNFGKSEKIKKVAKLGNPKAIF